jgi:hypothetical protein
MVASKVNEGMRMKENSERLEWLQIHVDLHTEEKALQEKITFNSLTNSVGPRRSLLSFPKNLSFSLVNLGFFTVVF